MLKKEEIKNGNFVFDKIKDSYGIISEVGNSRENGHRGCSSVPDDELSYSVTNLITGIIDYGICESSEVTCSYLSIATLEEVELFFLKREMEACRNLIQAKEKYNLVKLAMARFTNNA